MRTRGRRDLTPCGRLQVSFALKTCHAGVCTCMAIPITPTVAALAVLNGPLRSLRRLLSVAAWSVACSQLLSRLISDNGLLLNTLN